MREHNSPCLVLNIGIRQGNVFVRPALIEQSADHQDLAQFITRSAASRFLRSAAVIFLRGAAITHLTGLDFLYQAI